MNAKSEQIQRLNDQFRIHGPVGGDWFLTPGIQALGPAAVRQAIAATTAFADFSADNDPYGEHDFGSFDLLGHRLFWKIDYYDCDLQFGSPDPTDEQLTRRIMTILLASEY